MEGEFAKLLEESFKRPKKELVKGIVVKITEKEVFVDFGWKAEGVIPIKELGFKPEIGDFIEACIVEPETDEGYALLSVNCAKTLKQWQRIANEIEKRGMVEGIIRQRVRGGYKVDIGNGIFAFLPMSQVDVIPLVRPDDWLDRKIKAKVLSVDKKRKSIVISRRKLIEEQRKELRSKTLDRLKEGEVVDALVKNVVDFGIFVDVDGVDGLIHKSFISWSGLKDPSEVAKIGDKIKAKITKVDREKGRLFLSLKDLSEDPWKKGISFKKGDSVKGKVSRITSKGIFFELPGDVAGYLPSDKIPAEAKFRLKHLYELVVDGIDKSSRRVILKWVKEE